MDQRRLSSSPLAQQRPFASLGKLVELNSSLSSKRLSISGNPGAITASTSRKPSISATAPRVTISEPPVPMRKSSVTPVTPILRRPSNVTTANLQKQLEHQHQLEKSLLEHQEREREFRATIKAMQDQLTSQTMTLNTIQHQQRQQLMDPSIADITRRHEKVVERLNESWMDDQRTWTNEKSKQQQINSQMQSEKLLAQIDVEQLQSRVQSQDATIAHLSQGMKRVIQSERLAQDRTNALVYRLQESLRYL